MTDTNKVDVEPCAWSPTLLYPNYAEQRVWANGKPCQQDIDYWKGEGYEIDCAYPASALAALRQENERLKRINSDLCRTHNQRLIDGARQDEALAALRTQLAEAQADAARLRKALERVINCCDISECCTVPNSPGALKNARAALKGDV